MLKFSVHRASGGPAIAEIVTRQEPGKNYAAAVFDPAEHGVGGEKLRIHTRIPLVAVNGFWHPLQIRPVMTLQWTIDFTVAAHKGFPYLAFFSDAQRNSGAIALGDPIPECRFHAAMNQECGCYEVDMEITPRGKLPIFAQLDRSIEWPAVLEEYRHFVLPQGTPPYPEAAWDPVYCTWYAVHAAVTEPWVETNAARCAELGFKTLIVDDGWCFDTMKRVSPETLPTWYEEIGEWRVSPKKFPDFAAHVKRVQALGMHYLLWTAPFMIGDRSPANATVRCFPELDTAFRTTDPSDHAGMQNVLRRMAGLMRDYGLDGLKVDFIDTFAPDPQRPCAAEFHQFCRELAAAVRAVNPDAMLEYRQRYTSPHMLDCATQFRAGDVPFDFLANFNRIAQIRVSLGDRVPIHADPVYWTSGETPENIARHLAASLAGVPMASMDMTQLSAVETAVFRHYLGVYQSHRDLYTRGAWQVRYRSDSAAAIWGTLGNTTLAIVADAAEVPALLARYSGPERRLTILNIAPEPVIAPTARGLFAGTGEAVAPGTIPIGGRGEF